jgi:hypothetical protein
MLCYVCPCCIAPVHLNVDRRARPILTGHGERDRSASYPIPRAGRGATSGRGGICGLGPPCEFSRRVYTAYFHSYVKLIRRSVILIVLVPSYSHPVVGVWLPIEASNAMFLPCSFLLASLALSTPALATNVKTLSFLSPDGCMGDGLGVVRGEDAPALTALVPLSQGITCLERITVPTGLAKQTIEAYDGMFDLSYAFYDIAKNPPDSSPREIPSSWSVYGEEPNQGRVDLRQKSLDMMADVEANGANGLFPLKINSLYAEVRDCHTDTNIQAKYSMQLALMDTGLMKNGSEIPEETFYLSLSRGDDGKVRPVYKYEDSDGNLVREKAIATIDGQDGLEAMDTLVSNLGMPHYPSQLHSKGARMNAFLSGATVQSPDADDPPGQLWVDSDFYDVSLLPECLNVTFEASGSGDSEETQWCFFFLFGNPNEFRLPVEVYNEDYSTPTGTYAGFVKFIEEVNNSSQSLQIVTSDARRSLKKLTEKAVGNFTTWTSDSKGDVDPGETETDVGGYEMLDDGVMVFRLPEFVTMKTASQVWRDAVKFAKANNATKLLIDMIQNGGGDVQGQYFMRLALYPEMEYDDWKDEYTQRISGRMSRILKFIESSQAVSALFKEYGDEVDEAFRADPEALRQIAVSVVSSYSALNDLIQSELGGMVRIGPGDPIDTEEISSKVVLLKNYTDSAQGVAVDQEEALDALEYLLNVPGKVYSAQLAKGTQTVFQGGAEVNTTGVFNLLCTEKDFLETKGQVIPELPFTSYVLLNNGVSGSSASTFEQGVRAYAKKYAGQVTPLNAVSFGCLGDAETCPLTQYSGGSLGGGNAQLSAVYLAGPGLFGMNQAARFLNSSGALGDGASGSIVEKFVNDFDTEFLQQTPSPPSLAEKGPSYAYITLLPHAAPMSENVIPMEFLNQPADGYISMWPKPTTYTVGSGDMSSLPALYAEASKFFQTKSQAGETAVQEEGQPPVDEGQPPVDEGQTSSPSQLPSTSGVPTPLVHTALAVTLSMLAFMV